MRTSPVDVAAAAALAVGFAAVGETVLGRASRRLADWNSALVAGMGACAAAVFPLSLLAPRRAVDATFALIALCVLLSISKRLRRRGAPPHRAPSAEPPRGGIAPPLALGAAALLAFAALDLRYSLLWDGFAVWASKGHRLFVEGGLWRGWYAGEPYDSRYASYPALVPLYEALVGRLRGRFDFDGLKPLFLVFHGSMAVSVYSAVRSRAAARLAAWASAITLLVPALSTRWAAGGYADMPLAAVIAAVVAAGLRADGAAMPWLLGALTTVKPEGTVLALIGGAAALAAAPRPIRARVRGAAIFAVFLLLRLAFVRWTGVRDDTYLVGSVGAALARLPIVIRLTAAELLDPAAWGLLWPAFGAAAWVLARRGARDERALAAATAAGVVAMAGPFLFTTWPLELHISQAYFRLLAQLAPAAIVAVVLGYVRAREACLSGGRHTEEPRLALEDDPSAGGIIAADP